MARARKWLAVGVPLGLLGACGRPGAPATSESAPPPPVAAPAVAASAPAPVGDAAAADAAPRATLPTPAECAADDQCGWDDPCQPAACGAKPGAASDARCAKPKLPGQCRCAGGVCALVRPEDVREAARVACQSDAECAFDAVNGACVSGATSDPDAKGVVCECDTENRRCVQIWRGAVPCKSFRDCSHRRVNGKTTVPVPSWFAPRDKPNPIRPCKDGEIDSVCDAGSCRVQAWKC